MEFNINTALRSAVLLVVGLPLSAAVFMSVSKTDPTTDSISATKAPLVGVCLDYMTSKPDSKLERTAKTAIDDLMGADGADYKGLCNWVLN
jgi:hypothetical protein